LNRNQTHSPIVHQHVQKNVPCHAPGPYSFMQLWSSSCTSCTIPIIQQVKKTHKESIQVSDHFCETQTFAYWNLRSNLRNKSHRIYYRNPKRQNAIYLFLRCNSHRKGIANSPIWLNRNSQACESLQERNGGEGGYLQMLLWGRECHLALACGWCLEPVSFALLPWGTSMVDHQPLPPLIGIQQASTPVPSNHGQTSQTLLPSWPWLAALWSPSAALPLSAAPQTGKRHSRCLLRTKAAFPSSCTHSGLSGEHESSSCHGILLETLNWRSCL